MKKTKTMTMTKRLALELERVRTLVGELPQAELRHVHGGTSTTNTQGVIGDTVGG
jgi:hypothetical protein